MGLKKGDKLTIQFEDHGMFLSTYTATVVLVRKNRTVDVDMLEPIWIWSPTFEPSFNSRWFNLNLLSKTIPSRYDHYSIDRQRYNIPFILRYRILFFRETRAAALCFLCIIRMNQCINKDIGRMIAKMVYNSYLDEEWE